MVISYINLKKSDIISLLTKNSDVAGFETTF